MDEFLKRIGFLNALEFAGLAKTLNVELYEGEEPRLFADVLEEIAAAYKNLGRRERRVLLHNLPSKAKGKTIWEKACEAQEAQEVQEVQEVIDDADHT